MKKHKEVLEERLDCAKLYLSGDNTTTELGIIRANEEVEALQYAISLMDRVDEEKIKKVLDNEHIHIINTNLSKAIISYLTGEKKE